MSIKQGLPSHYHITPEEPTPEEHQRILYPDTRAARQQFWARNSEGTQTLKQQDQIYLSTSLTQVCAPTAASQMMCQAMSSCGVGLGSVLQSSSWAQLPSKRPPGERWFSSAWRKMTVSHPTHAKNNEQTFHKIHATPAKSFFKKDSSKFTLSYGIMQPFICDSWSFNGIYSCITHTAQTKENNDRGSNLDIHRFL